MAVALTPNAFLLSLDTAWDTGVFFSWCGWRRIDVDRGEFTVLAYLGANTVGSGGFQFTADPARQLVVFDAGPFTDLLAGTGPTLAVGDWWFFGLTTIAADVPNNVVIYYARAGDIALTSATVSYSGAYDYQRHYVNARPGTDGAGGAFWLHGSAAHDRTWQDTTLTPTEMLAEFGSETVVKAGAWSVWPMATAATVTADASGNGRLLTATPGTGTITDTDGPFDAGINAALAAVLPALTATITAEGSADAALAGTLPALTAALTADGVATATVTATLPALESQTTAEASADTAVAAVLPALTADVAIDASVSAAVDAVLPALTAALSVTADVDITAVLAATLPAPTAAITVTSGSTPSGSPVPVAYRESFAAVAADAGGVAFREPARAVTAVSSSSIVFREVP